jgi:hypothetical protein
MRRSGSNRHCEEQSDEAIQTKQAKIRQRQSRSGLLRCARNDGP